MEVGARSLRRALLALGVVGFVAGAVPLALALANEGGHQRELIAVTGPLIGWAFVGTGIYAWLRQPDNRFGALMAAVGFSACLAGLRVSTEPWVFIFGLLFITSQWALLYHMLLAFPGGRLHSPLERALVGGMYLSAWVVHPVQVLFQDTTSAGFPENPLLIEGHPELSADLSRARFWFALGLLAALAVILARRWLTARRSQWPALAPVYLSGGLVLLLLGVWYAAMLAGVDQDVAQGLEDARYVVLATVPFAFLAGLLQSRVAGAATVSEVVTALGDPGMRGNRIGTAFAEALRGTSLELAFWIPSRAEYVDVSGRRFELPPDGSQRVVTRLESDGQQLALLAYDSTRDDERELVRAVAAATTLTLENDRLAAELRANVEQLRASRTRIVESGDEARRRLERDLHDGAQQRLVSLALTLRALGSRTDGDPELSGALQAARVELDRALVELRELARGIHPAILSDAGLDGAIGALVARAPMPVTVLELPDRRLPSGVETAAYFVVAEALTNVAKYAKAGAASVSIRREDGYAVVEVRDDGVGGASPDAGSGLRGLSDRVAALDGELDLRSPPGEGTTLRARMPLA
jgi:signal transduction histidine kinase